MKYLLAVLTLALTLVGTANAQTTIFNCSSGWAATGSTCSLFITFFVSDGGQDFWMVGAPNGSTPALSSGAIVYPTGSTHIGISVNYRHAQVNIQAFTSSFTFIPNGQNIIWMVQNSNNNPGGFNGANFSNGASCEADFFQGFAQVNPPNNVFAIELDSYSPLSNPASFTYSSAQIYQSNQVSYPNLFVQCPCIPDSQCGTNNSDAGFNLVKLSTSPVPLNSPASTQNTTTGDTYKATVTYDGSNFTLNLFDVTAGGSCPGVNCYTNTWTGINIPNQVGANIAWVGLGLATGTSSLAPATMSSFSYTVNPVGPTSGGGAKGGGGMW